MPDDPVNLFPEKACNGFAFGVIYRAALVFRQIKGAANDENIFWCTLPFIVFVVLMIELFVWEDVLRIFSP